ncbi:SPL family radical SAM protein [Enterococcus sp. HY326]|uniref:SPL family radical SAM protein n=1 Tax=Enterococcus sp. HY326 TaxID=2971265 RepID=UPI00223EDDEC|nr:radical SAM protein [Enterococcus sp. HY326]
MNLLPAKKILMKTKNKAWLGTDYTMNLYKGCHHGCIYCDSRSRCYGIENFERVTGKQNALQMLALELQQKRQKAVIGDGSMSDSYNAFEKKYQLTRQALELFDTFDFGVSLATKSDLILRDQDLLKKISGHAPVNISFSFSTIDDALASKIEKRVSLPSQRMAALKELTASGLYSGILLMPILPALTDDWSTIEKLVLQAKENGAAYIYPFWGVTLRDIQKEYYFQQLKNIAPNLLQKYQQASADNYYYPIENLMETKRKFKKLCCQLQLEYSMTRIIEKYQQRYQVEQLSLF